MVMALESPRYARGTPEEAPESTSEGFLMRRHVFTPEEASRGLSRANSPEGVAARVESRKRNAETRRQYVRDLYEWGQSIGYIARQVGLSESTIRQMVVGTSRPRYGRGVIECQHEPPHTH